MGGSRQIVAFCFAFALAFIMLPNVWKIYDQKLKSGLISRDQPTIVPPVTICGDWINRTALKETLTLAEEFWKSDGSGWTMYNMTNPPLCTVITSLFNGNPNIHEFDFIEGHSDPHFQIKHRQNIATFNAELTKQNLSLTQLIDRISYDGTHMIKRITTDSGMIVKYKVEPIKLSVGTCYKITVDKSARSLFAGSQEPVNIVIEKDFGKRFGFGCEMVNREMIAGRKLLFFTDEIERQNSNDLVLMDGQVDMEVQVSSHEITMQPGKPSQCSHNPQRWDKCMYTCQQKKSKCKFCRVFSYGLESEPVYNITNACNRFQGAVKNCFFFQLLSEPEIIPSCSIDCNQPCKRTIFNVQTKTVKHTEEEKRFKTEHTLTLKQADASSSTAIVEFYTYPLPVMLLTAAGIIGMFLGYSFVTSFEIFLTLTGNMPQYRSM